jgi:hypothetical protein
VRDHQSIPDDVRRFILTSIPSVPFLEAALLFRRQPLAQRTTGDVARSLYVSEAAAGELLNQMQGAGIVEATADHFRYAAPQALDEALGALAVVYAKNLIGVTELIHDATQKQAQQFADAFQLRRRT